MHVDIEEADVDVGKPYIYKKGLNKNKNSFDDLRTRTRLNKMFMVNQKGLNKNSFDDLRTS